MTKLRAQLSDYPIKTIRLDNAGEFTSQTLNDYYMSIGINIEHHIAHVNSYPKWFSRVFDQTSSINS